MKLRTPDGAIYVSTWKALGAVPTPMALTELYTSLQTGVVQGTELPLQGIEALKIHEILKNFAAINYMNDPICFSVSLQFYKSLTPELQKAVMKAAKESTVAERSAARDSYDKALQKVIAAGVKASRPDTAAFRKMVAPVYDEYYKKTGANGRALVEGILALTK
jgi:TRAP-type C4-dicarboxylate transport system substrate-binding protein